MRELQQVERSKISGLLLLGTVKASENVYTEIDDYTSALSKAFSVCGPWTGTSASSGSLLEMQTPRLHDRHWIRICIYQDYLEILLTLKFEKHWLKGVLKPAVSELRLEKPFQILMYSKQSSLLQGSKNCFISFLPTRSKYCFTDFIVSSFVHNFLTPT